MKCQVDHCPQEGKWFRIYLDSANSTALNGYLCDDHYNRLLDVIRTTINFWLPTLPQENTRSEK